jgi:hypothetical protein
MKMTFEVHKIPNSLRLRPCLVEILQAPGSPDMGTIAVREAGIREAKIYIFTYHGCLIVKLPLLVTHKDKGCPTLQATIMIHPIMLLSTQTNITLRNYLLKEI